MKLVKEQGMKYKPITFGVENTPKQLLARNRIVIAKKQNQWLAN